MIQIVLRIAISTYVSMKQIFLEVNKLSYLYRNKKGRKNLNSNNHLGDTKFNE